MGVLFILSAFYALTFNNVKLSSIPNRFTTFNQRYRFQDHFFLPSFKQSLTSQKLTPFTRNNNFKLNQLINSLLERQTSFVGSLSKYEKENKKQGTKQSFVQSDYELQDQCVSEVVHQLFDKSNPKTIQHVLPTLIECDKIFEKHPALKQLVENQRINPSMVNFIQEIQTIENLPPKTAQTKVELQKNLKEMNKKDKLIFAYHISKKFK